MIMASTLLLVTKSETTFVADWFIHWIYSRSFKHYTLLIGSFKHYSLLIGSEWHCTRDAFTSMPHRNFSNNHQVIWINKYTCKVSRVGILQFSLVFMIQFSNMLNLPHFTKINLLSHTYRVGCMVTTCIQTQYQMEIILIL